MSILSDIEIIERVSSCNMISEFSDKLINKIGENKIISYGLSSYGYDARVSGDFLIFNNLNSLIVDPKNFDDSCVISKKNVDFCIIPPNSFVLCKTIEYFKVPRDILMICIGKSTYARCGVIINVTPIEPEWEGNVTIEVSNTTQLPVKIYSNEGICQFLFLKSNISCQKSYLDRNGKYLYQKEITFAKV